LFSVMIVEDEINILKYMEKNFQNLKISKLREHLRYQKKLWKGFVRFSRTWYF
jgi:hypothetical protein